MPIRKHQPGWPKRMLLAVVLSTSVILGSTTLDVPYVAQVKAGCGSAAIAMVVQYWAQQQKDLSSTAAATEDIDRWLPPSKKGIAGKALKTYLQNHGFDAYIFDGEASDLAHHIEKGRPVVVCLAPGGTHKPLHYAVVVGIDNESVWLNDSARGKLYRQSRASFANDWDATGDWALLAVPRPSH